MELSADSLLIGRGFVGIRAVLSDSSPVFRAFSVVFLIELFV